MFEEYPKWLHFDGAESVLVQDAEGEAQALAAHVDAAEELPVEVADEGEPAKRKYTRKRAAE